MSDLIVFGKRAGEHAARFARKEGAVKAVEEQIRAAAKSALEPFERDARGQNDDNPFRIQEDLREMMQEKVGIIRTEKQMLSALADLEQLWKRVDRVGVGGNREYNPGWHTALDLRNLLFVSEAITRSGLERKESRGAHTRDDFPGKEESFSRFNVVVRQNSDGRMEVRQEPIPSMPEELKKIIEEMG